MTPRNFSEILLNSEKKGLLSNYAIYDFISFVPNAEFRMHDLALKIKPNSEGSNYPHKQKQNTCIDYE